MSINNVLFDHSGYRGNKVLKKPGLKIDWTPELLAEFVKCSKDPIYFGENYFKIVNVDRGLETVELYPYQKEIINSVWKGKRTIAECARQSGKCVKYDTFINVRNKKTNEIMHISIGDFYEIVKSRQKGDTS